MIEIFPCYYEKFRCIAHLCKHSCCVGWEIDVDENTMEFYNTLEGDLGDKIRSNIKGEPPHFVLTKDERCPFLCRDGLCEIISHLGEDALCDICYLHPRFSNFYDDFAETGLGLCCEEAARIILSQTEKFNIDLPSFAKDDEFFAERNEAFDILQNRNISMFRRLENLCKKYDFDFEFSNEKLYDFYKALERLDEFWQTLLEKIKTGDAKSVLEKENLQIFFEQLACYFIFRHFEKGIGMAVMGCYVVALLCDDCNTFEQMADIVRMYSCEIEYSEENTQKISEYIENNNQ